MKRRGLGQLRGGATLKEIADELGCTRQRVQQIEARALRRARENAIRMGYNPDDLLPRERDEPFKPPRPDQ